MIIPAIPEGLIEYLDALYPAKHPSLQTPDREVWFKAGQRDVVEHLLALEQERQVGITEGLRSNVLLQLRSVGPQDRAADAGPSGTAGPRSSGAAGNRLRGDG